MSDKVPLEAIRAEGDFGEGFLETTFGEEVLTEIRHFMNGFWRVAFANGNEADGARRAGGGGGAGGDAVEDLLVTSCEIGGHIQTSKGLME